MTAHLAERAPIDVLRALDIDYVATNPASSCRGLHESINNYAMNKKPELLTATHEEIATAMAHGYAKVSKTEQQHWQKQLETYLSKREGIVKVIHLIDGRHEIQQNDRQMAEWLTHYNLPIQLAFTKWDKVKPSDRTKRLKEISASVECENTQELLQMVWFSDLKDNTRQKFLDDIASWLLSGDEE